MSPVLTSPPSTRESAQDAPVRLGIASGQRHRAAIDLLAGAILDRQTFISATGEDGAANRSVLDSVTSALAEHPVRFIRVGNPLTSPLTLRRVLLQIGCTEQAGLDQGDAESVLEALRARRGIETQVVLVIEQAETLQPQALSVLQLLPGVSDRNSPSLQLLFAGRPEFWVLLEDAQFERLRQQITTRVAVESPGEGPRLEDDQRAEATSV